MMKEKHGVNRKKCKVRLQGKDIKLYMIRSADVFLITFREIVYKDGKLDNNWMAGDWVAWVGTYEDLLEQKTKVNTVY